jgi:hypothetical protein
LRDRFEDTIAAVGVNLQWTAGDLTVLRDVRARKSRFNDRYVDAKLAHFMV